MEAVAPQLGRVLWDARPLGVSVPTAPLMPMTTTTDYETRMKTTTTTTKMTTTTTRMGIAM